MDVHLRDLRALAAVAEEGTVTGAAARLHLAQPALSRGLRELERQLGVALLERHPRGVVLTEANRVVLECARDALAVAATADEAFEAVASGLGVALIAEGNADLYRRPGVVTRSVVGLSPAVLALAWRTGERRPTVAAFVRAVEDSLEPHPAP